MVSIPNRKGTGIWTIKTIPLDPVRIILLDLIMRIFWQINAVGTHRQPEVLRLR